MFGEMFDSDSADMCAGKFPLVLMGGRAEDLACAALAKICHQQSIIYDTIFDNFRNK